MEAACHLFGSRLFSLVGDLVALPLGLHSGWGVPPVAHFQGHLPFLFPSQDRAIARDHASHEHD